MPKDNITVLQGGGNNREAQFERMGGELSTLVRGWFDQGADICDVGMVLRLAEFEIVNLFYQDDEE